MLSSESSFYAKANPEHYNTTEEQEIDLKNQPYKEDIISNTGGHMNYDKEARILKWKQERIFNKWCWCKRMQIGHIYHPAKNYIQVDQGTQIETWDEKNDRRKDREDTTKYSFQKGLSE